jgi:recombination protein RecA
MSKHFADDFSYGEKAAKKALEGEKGLKKSTKEEKKKTEFEEKLAELTKKFGKGTFINAVDKESYGDVIPTTPFSLGNALGINGFAKNKLYTIDGDSSAGKSTTAYDVIGNCQKIYGDNCLLIDKEDSYTREYGAKLGINNDKLVIAAPHTLEDMYDLLVDSLKSGIFGCILVDSVTSFAPAARFENSVVLGMEARVNSDKMRLVMDALENSGVCLIYIMQTRQKLGGYGDPTTVSGGTAIPFYAHVRIRVTRSEIDRENEQNVMKFTVIKNKLAPAFKVGTVVYNWKTGFDLFSEMGDLAIEFGLIRNEGKTYFLPETDMKIVGKKNVVQHLKDNPEYVKEVLQPLVKNHLDSSNLRKEDLNEDIEK